MHTESLRARYQNCMTLDFIIDKRLRVRHCCCRAAASYLRSIKKNDVCTSQIAFRLLSFSRIGIIMLLCIQLCILGARIG
jgi:hypothetical protein